MAIFIVRHITTYRYKREIRLGRHQLMARPRDSFDQRLINFLLDITPKPSEVRWLHDVFGNCVAHVEFDCVSDHLRFECVIKVDHTPENAPDFRIEDWMNYSRSRRSPPLASCYLDHSHDCNGSL
jgi:hypothetical protein